MILGIGLLTTECLIVMQFFYDKNRYSIYTLYYYYYNHFTAHWTMSRTTRVICYQKDKTNLDLLEQEIVNGSGISWAICKSAPRPRPNNHANIHHSVFTGLMPFLPPNQQRQNTEAFEFIISILVKNHCIYNVHCFS